MIFNKVGQLKDATENYICCIACCTEKSINESREPNLYKLFLDLPYANVYAKHKQTGKKWKPGSFEIMKGDGPNVIVIFARMYSGCSAYPGDDEGKRKIWFQKALDSLTTYTDLESLAFDEGIGYLDGNGSKEEYQNLVSDFLKIYNLRNKIELKISLYSNNDQVCPKKKTLFFKKKTETDATEEVIKTEKRLGMVNKPTVSKLVFYETDFFKYKLKDSDNSGNSGNSGNSDNKEQSSVGILRSIPFDQSWRWILLDAQAAKYLSDVENKLGPILLDNDTFPVKEEIFEAFNACPFNKLKVVILGQDPYPTRGNAHGLSFSVREGVKVPRSLSNIYNAIVNDEGVPGFVKPKHGNLIKWAEQGILLLNSGLTVKEGSINCGCHVPIWSNFTDRVIQMISDKTTNVAFVLWGAKAKAKAKLINASKHMIFEYHHPTARNNNTFVSSCKHFGEINKYLSIHKKQPIDWSL